MAMLTKKSTRKCVFFTHVHGADL